MNLIVRLVVELHHHQHAISTGISDPLSPPLPIIHCFWQIFQATSSIWTELLYVCSSWTSCLCSSLWRGPQEYITYELVPTSPAVSLMVLMMVHLSRNAIVSTLLLNKSLILLGLPCYQSFFIYIWIVRE